MISQPVSDTLLLTREDLQSELKRFVREDLQLELKRFMEESFAQELKKLGAQTYKEVHDSLHLLLDALKYKHMSPSNSEISTRRVEVSPAVMSPMSVKSNRESNLSAPATNANTSASVESVVMTAILPSEVSLPITVNCADTSILPNTLHETEFEPTGTRQTLETVYDSHNGVLSVGTQAPTKSQETAGTSSTSALNHLGSFRVSEDSVKFREPRLRKFQRGGHDNLVRRMRETLRATSSLFLEPDWLHTIKRMVKHEYFDYIMGLFLIANALSIGWQTNYMATQDSSVVPTGFRLLMGFFCIVFTCELCLRITCYGRFFFTMQLKGWQWNFFDILVVTVQIVDELTQIILAGAGEEGGLVNSSALRMLRIFRVIRLIRMVRLIPELKNMVYLIFASMWSFVWTAVLLLLMMYVFAVYYTEISTDLRHDNVGNDAASGSSQQQSSNCANGCCYVAADPNGIQAIQDKWGSLGTSMFSLFMAITGGDDWFNFVEVFKGHSYFVHTMIFCGYVGFAVLVMLNLVTGVFVEGAQRIVQEDKDNDLVKQVCKLFQDADMDGNHYITWGRFQEQLETEAMADYFAAVDLNVDEAKGLFQLLDTDDSGSLTIDEFVQGCLRLKGPARSVDLASLVIDFKMQWRLQKDRWNALEHQMNRLAFDVHRIFKKMPLAETHH